MADLPDLNDLQLLLDVVEHGSIGAAASARGLSQPQASRRLADFERRLGVSLFVRSNRGTALTPEGRVVADWATLTIAAAENFTRSVDGLRAARRRDIRVAVSMTIAEHLAPGWLAILQHTHPDLTPSLSVSNSAGVAELVRSGECELGFVESSTRYAGLRRRRFGGDTLVVAVANDHPWAARRSVAADELAQGRLLAREVGSGTRDALEAALARRGLTVAPGPTLASNSALKSAAAAGLGAVVVSELSLRQELRTGALSEVAVDDLDLTRTFWAIWRDHDRLSDAAAAVASAARKQLDS